MVGNVYALSCTPSCLGFLADDSYQNPSILENAQSDWMCAVCVPKYHKITSIYTWHISIFQLFVTVVIFSLRWSYIDLDLCQILSFFWNISWWYYNILSNALLTSALMALTPCISRTLTTSQKWNYCDMKLHCQEKLLFLCNRFVSWLKVESIVAVT